MNKGQLQKLYSLSLFSFNSRFSLILILLLFLTHGIHVLIFPLCSVCASCVLSSFSRCTLFMCSKIRKAAKNLNVTETAIYKCKTENP